MNDKKKAVFLDRDGTLIEEVDFLSTVEETRLFPFTVEALKLLSSAGFEFVVVTNQSGIARGYFSGEHVEAIHAKIQSELRRNGLEIASFHYCPHLPDAGCDCRKPNSGMINQALEMKNFDLAESWVIGDKQLDVDLGHNVGARSVLVRTGYGASHESLLVRDADIVAENLLEAARKIVDLQVKN
jgi:D-glycero-D-manno-heptose 1,7-bisphosphate phosphatase